MQDLVSIIMPSYNTAKYISETIESVQSQTYPFWELIIVDDCSTDNTDEVVKPYLLDDRIRYLKNDSNSGAAISRNRALREARGRWIAFLDSDDVWLAEKLERQLNFMIKNNYKFTYTDYRIRLNGEWMPYINIGPKKITKLKLYNYCYFSTITVIYDREYVGLIQIADLKKNNDYAMWFQIIEKTPCYRFPECLSYYYRHNNSISSGNKLRLIKHHYIMYRKALDKNKIVALLLTVNNLFWGVLKKIFYKKKVEF
ncbi:glycosyltransferase [Clostridium perfringens]|uniref:glycosyltransferase family 2 protein n=1 Tax=Clostridium perfringens TaxID=1502 RepID=UPI00103D79DE|nr:glycosyltransferase family 2 protein [Clostridium perfringens]EJT5925421.1 glycosyltransferase family 2 protein [Clostridium perfringens]MBO3378989.1 glycosyltransferase family 2 protein [Clostridium perfringens]MCX0361213.1 glycosyltransferase [Clostridium perfringens]MDK0639141.1 glycosyltransferase family 2 protein [Clostridium perfringens]MDK0784655.1 glycosyltransferase family 2 protein [Clostridium perfringens]